MDAIQLALERMVIISAVIAGLFTISLFLGGYMTAKIQALIDQLAATGKTVDAALAEIKAHADGATPDEVAKLVEAVGELKPKTDALAAALTPPAP